MFVPFAEERRIAYHESAHSVFAWFFGQRIDEVCIDRALIKAKNPNGMGYSLHTADFCRTEPEPDETKRMLRMARMRTPENIRLARHEAMTLLAGHLAEYRLAGGDSAPALDCKAWVDSWARDDFILAFSLLGHIRPPGVDLFGYLNCVHDKAYALLCNRRLWAGVTTLANALLRNGTVDGEKAHEVIATAVVNAKHRWPAYNARQRVLAIKRLRPVPPTDMKEAA